MDRELIGKIEPASGGTDGVEVADHVGDGHIWRRQFLDVAVFAMEPSERRLDALFRDELLARAADRGVRVVVDLTTGNDWDLVVEESGQASEHPCFSLAAEPQENEMVPRQERVHELGNDGIAVADDPGKKLFARAHLLDQVVADLVAHAARLTILQFT